MSLLESVQNMQGADRVLGIQFCSPTDYAAYLPEGSRVFGNAGSKLFFFADGYQETVFVLDRETGSIQPLAYDFSEFLRLIFACGSAQWVADMGQTPSDALQNVQEPRQSDLQRMQDALHLTPIHNPGEYVRTIGQVIDCSRIRP